MNSLKIIIPVLILFILAVGGVYTIYKAQTSGQDNFSLNPIASPRSNFPRASTKPSPQTIASTVPQTQPSTGTDDQEVKNEGIQIENLNPGQKISSPVRISGKANVTSQTVHIDILDTASNLLGQGDANTCVGLDACPFEASIIFSQPSTHLGTVHIYSPSTIDGSPTYPTTLPISF